MFPCEYLQAGRMVASHARWCEGVVRRTHTIDPTGDNMWATFYRYNSDGQWIWEVRSLRRSGDAVQPLDAGRV